MWTHYLKARRRRCEEGEHKPYDYNEFIIVLVEGKMHYATLSMKMGGYGNG